MLNKTRHFLPLFFAITILFFSACSSFSGRDFEVTLVSYGDNEFKVDVAKYGSATASQKTLIILPPTGGENFVDRSYARQFTKAGYDVFILREWTGMSEKSTELEIHQRLYGRAQKAIELVLNQIRSPYIGLLGTSVGALHGAVAASKQNRLQSVFVIAGGAPIIDVIVTSDQPAMEKLRSERKARYGFKDVEENRLALQQKFSLEPMQLGDGYKQKNLGMVIATEDETVPTLNQKKLQDFWNPKKVIVYQNGHFWGIVKTWMFDGDTILDFFESNLSRN